MSTLASDIRPFDVCGPLPTGVTVLEASAGTGKTFTIAALAARYVAEGTPLDQLLLVTFTRMATGELRERVRERLVSAEQGLDRALAGAPPTTTRSSRCWRRARPNEVADGASDLARALADFDAATIATTHGFCQEVLGGLGVAGDVEPDATFVEDVSDLLAEVVDDLYVRRWHGSDDAPVRPRAGDADRPDRGRQPRRARRARGRAGTHRSRRCAGAWRSPSARSSTRRKRRRRS